MKAGDQVNSGYDEGDLSHIRHGVTFMWRKVASFFSAFRGKTLSEQMKTKNFYVLVLFLLATLTSLWILIDPSPNLHTIVSETHRQISNIHIPTKIRQDKNEMLDVNQKYLDALGMVFSKSDPARLIVNVSKEVVLKTEPVIVVPVLPGAYDEARTFLASVKKFLPGKLVVFWDLGLSGKENNMLRKVCNGTVFNCNVKMFAYNKYPSHVQSHNLGSYVPLCIQESLSLFNVIIWSNPKEYFITKDISGVVAKARETGIAAWTIKDATSSITYFKMFTYFDVTPEQYYFHRAIKTSHLVVFNTEFIKKDVMLPWVKCALVEECISPTGSQNSGGYCIERKPRYLYSGCHNYEQSALNLILGKSFKFDESPYVVTDKIFGEEKMNKTVTSEIQTPISSEELDTS
ncbi:uncharacterized protein LOC127881840 [Dreissena polymorpha]|nr:uncharacterized protein LOC127881840 [Dreissena polymorpha]